MGAVGGLRRVKHAALAAKMVLQHTAHSLLVGDAATAFALEMGIPGTSHDSALPLSFQTTGLFLPFGILSPPLPCSFASH